MRMPQTSPPPHTKIREIISEMQIIRSAHLQGIVQAVALMVLRQRQPAVALHLNPLPVCPEDPAVDLLRPGADRCDAAVRHRHVRHLLAHGQIRPDGLPILRISPGISLPRAVPEYRQPLLVRLHDPYIGEGLHHRHMGLGARHRRLLSSMYQRQDQPAQQQDCQKKQPQQTDKRFQLHPLGLIQRSSFEPFPSLLIPVIQASLSCPPDSLRSNMRSKEQPRKDCPLLLYQRPKMPPPAL